MTILFALFLIAFFLYLIGMLDSGVSSASMQDLIYKKKVYLLKIMKASLKLFIKSLHWLKNCV